MARKMVTDWRRRQKTYKRITALGQTKTLALPEFYYNCNVSLNQRFSD